MEYNDGIYGEEYSFYRPYLVSDEYVLWQGKPEGKGVFTKQDAFMIPFSIIWCGFALFWEITAIRSGAPGFFALFGLMFVIVGLYLVFGRFIQAAYLRKRTAYVITNKKIIRKRGNKIDILDGKTMPPMFVDIHKDGTGTIRFGQDVVYHNGWNRRTVHNMNTFTIENVRDVVQVQEIINNMEK